MPTRLSVVLFCRNCERTLDKALASVINQDVEVELLVLDGGSTDRSVDLIRKYEKKIAFWRSEADGSSTNAINEGMRRATGDVIGLLAGDDWYEPNTLGSVVKRFDMEPDLTVLSCGTRFAFCAENGSLVGDRVFIDESDLLFDLPNLFRNPLTCGRFIKRTTWVQLGGYDPAFKTGDDLDFLIRLYFLRPRSGINPALTYTYRAHQGSRTLRGDRDSVIAMARDNLHIARKYLNAPEVTPEERKRLLGCHDEFASLVVWNSLRSLRLRQAVEFTLRAVKLRTAWPLFFFHWLTAQMRLKIGKRWTTR